jgi:glycosyltransferase involved in cell wall biosynthesis
MVAHGAPLVSVILPTYRRGPYLARSIESALAQTYRNFEIIVTDNAAAPEVAALVEGYRDPRLRYRHNGSNIGAAKNALAGYREARGEFLSTLHDDDLWEPTLLEALVTPLIRQPDLSLSFSDHWIMRPDGTLDAEATEANTRLWGRAGLAEGVHRPFFRLALIDRAISVVASIYRRATLDLDDYPDQVGSAYDLWMAYLASRGGLGAYYVPRRLLRYRVHQGALSAGRYEQPIVYCFDRFIADDRLASIRRELLEVRAGFDTSLGISLLREGRRAEARPPLRRGLRYRPELRGWASLALSYAPGVVFSSVDRLRRALLARRARRAFPPPR